MKCVLTLGCGFRQLAEFIVWASRGAMGKQDVYLPGFFPCALDQPKKHLTEKPLEFAREVVRLVPDGGTVCDPFAGSGTFLVAAKEAGLNWISCEAMTRISMSHRKDCRRHNERRLTDPDQSAGVDRPYPKPTNRGFLWARTNSFLMHSGCFPLQPFSRHSHSGGSSGVVRRGT